MFCPVRRHGWLWERGGKTTAHFRLAKPELLRWSYATALSGGCETSNEAEILPYQFFSGAAGLGAFGSYGFLENRNIESDRL